MTKDDRNALIEKLAIRIEENPNTADLPPNYFLVELMEQYPKEVALLYADELVAIVEEAYRRMAERQAEERGWIRYE